MKAIASDAKVEFLFGTNGELLGFKMRLPPGALSKRITRVFYDRSALTVEKVGLNDISVRVD